jgi:hypothetical protein
MRFKYALVAVAAVIVATATVSAAVLPAAPRQATLNQGAWTPLALSKVAFPSGVTIDHEAVFVITTQEEYSAFLRTLPTAPPGRDFPTLDFTNSFLVVASYGFKDLGYAITVDSAKTNGERIVVTVDRQTDNPEHCRITHSLQFEGQLAVIAKPSTLDVSPGTVGIANRESVMPYDSFYNCGCPEM